MADLPPNNSDTAILLAGKASTCLAAGETHTPVPAWLLNLHGILNTVALLEEARLGLAIGTLGGVPGSYDSGTGVTTPTGGGPKGHP